jgi:hypothetical protein
VLLYSVLFCSHTQMQSPSNPYWKDKHRLLQEEASSPPSELASTLERLGNWLDTLQFEFGPQPKSVSLAKVYLARYLRASLASSPHMCSPDDDSDELAAALACLFIASKLEQVRWPIHMHGSLQKRGLRVSDLSHAAGKPDVITPEVILEHEKVVLQRIFFYLACT